MNGLLTNAHLYINEAGRWCDAENDTVAMTSSAPLCPGDIVKHRLNKTFFDVYTYYANLIDYARILMAVAALALIFQNTSNEDAWCSIVLNYTIASLIFGSVLLDAVDGKVARYFNQSTVMGCGWDWLADIFAQYCLAVWCLYKQSSDQEWVSLEITNRLLTLLLKNCLDYK
jgi:phosphatidylglycerophosphate synthase